MSNAITITTDLQFKRVSKSGKITVRGALGALMSGTKGETATISRVMVQKLVANNTFGPVMAELVRVFPPSGLLKFGAFKVGETFAFLEGKTLLAVDGNWDAQLSGAYCRAVVARCDAMEAASKAVKGERALAAEFADEVVRHLEAKAIEKLEAMLAATQLPEIVG